MDQLKEIFYGIERYKDNHMPPCKYLKEWGGRMYYLELDLRHKRHETWFATFVEKALQRDRLNQQIAIRYFAANGVLDTIYEFIDKHEGFQPDFVDLYFLYRFLIATEPQVVLEFGSGLSTYVMALALQRNGKGRLYSVEPDVTWQESTIRWLSGDLRDIVTVTYSEGARKQVNGEEVVVFAQMPDVVPDFVYLDGAPAGAKYLGAETLMDFLQTTGAKPAIFIDARFLAAQYLDNHLPDKRIYAQGAVHTRTSDKVVADKVLHLFSNTLILAN